MLDTTAPTDAGRWYLAGPMTGIPQFNFPLFFKAAEALRNNGFTIISPAEIDTAEDAAAALASPDGAPGAGNGGCSDKTWGDFLARDVKLIADSCTGIVLLPNWEGSPGARLEAFVGLMAEVDFALYLPGGHIERVNPMGVLRGITHATYWKLDDKQ